MSQLNTLFSNPLIIGASISAGFLSPGPGTLLAQKFNPGVVPTILAGSGYKGRDFFSRNTLSVFDRRSVIIALDLFFWDSTLIDINRSVEAIHALANASQNARLVIGDVPSLFPQFQPSAKLLSSEITKTFKNRLNTKLIPLSALHERLVRDGFIDVAGARFQLRDFMPDGLHVGPLGSQFLADYVEQFLIQDF